MGIVAADLLFHLDYDHQSLPYTVGEVLYCYSNNIHVSQREQADSEFLRENKKVRKWANAHCSNYIADLMRYWLSAQQLNEVESLQLWGDYMESSDTWWFKQHTAERSDERENLSSVNAGMDSNESACIEFSFKNKNTVVVH